MNRRASVEAKPAMSATRENDGVRTYRGRTLEEVLPMIKSELGPEAVILRQRDGLTGGVGGFFQRPCIEVDARPPEEEQAPPRNGNGRRFDAYDEGDAVAPPPQAPDFEPLSTEPAVLLDPATAEGLSSPAIQEMLRQAAPFAEQLSAAAEQEPAYPTAPEPRPAIFEPAAPAAPAPAPTPAAGTAAAAPPAPLRGRPPVADANEARLTDAGLTAELAAELI